MWNMAAEDFFQGFAVVYGEEGCGLINAWGEQVVPCRWQEVALVSEGLVRVCADDLFGFVDTRGEVVVPCQYEEAAFSFDEGLAWVEREGKQGCVNAQGVEILPCEYECVQCSGGYAFALKDGLLSIFDRTGARIV